MDKNNKYRGAHKEIVAVARLSIYSSAVQRKELLLEICKDGK